MRRIFLIICILAICANAWATIWISPVGGGGGATGAPGAAGEGVPTGGTTGQVLAKESEDNYDTAWIDPPVVGHDEVSIGTANGLSLDGQILSLDAATSSTAGAMTAAMVVALAAIDTEAELEALLDLADLQGQVTDAQIPSTIARDSELPVISDVAYDSTSWDANTDGASKNAIRDEIQAIYTVLGSLPATHDAVTIGTANGLSLATQVLSLAAATSSSAGAMTAAQVTALEAIDTEAELEAMLDLADLQGQVTDAQIPSGIARDSELPVISDTAYGASWDANTDGASKNAIYDKIESLAGGHDPVTIGTANGLSLVGQELSLGQAITIQGGSVNADSFSAYADLSAESKIGTGSAQVAAGDHTHTGIYEPAGITASDISNLNAGTDITADLEEETHASEHAVGGADSVFPANPASDGILMRDVAPTATTEWAAIGSLLTYDGATLNGSESGIEAVCDLQDFQGAVTDAQVPDNITITGLLSASADETISGAWTLTGNFVNTAYPWADNEVADSLTIQGGSVNNDSFSAYSDLGAESKIGTGAAQVAAGDHTHTGVYEPYDADIAKVNEAETLTANWVNTVYPWADNEVADNLTISGGSVSTDSFSAYTDLADESKIGTGSAQVAAGDHTHTGIYEPAGITSSDIGDLNAGTDITADLEEETHASEHAVGGADSVFPTDPGADSFLFWNDSTNALGFSTVTSALMADADHGDVAWSSGVASVQAIRGTTVDATDIGDGKILKYNAATSNLEYETDTGGVTDHGALSGLSDDDHPQYGALAQAETITGNWVNTANPWTDDEVADALTIDGGTINSTTIGATTPSSGAFTTVEVGDAIDTEDEEVILMTVEDDNGDVVWKKTITCSDLDDGSQDCQIKEYVIIAGTLTVQATLP